MAPAAMNGAVLPRARVDLSGLVFASLALLLCALVLLPLAWLVWFGITDKSGAATLGNFTTLAADPSFTRPFVLTLGVALAVSLLSCLVATPLAWLVARTDMPGRRTVRLLVMASFVTPPFLGAIAWEILAAPNSGALNQWYRALFDLEADAHVFDIYTVEGLVFVMTCYAFPYVFVLAANALERIPADLEDAAAILGSGRWQSFRRISLPLVMPSLLAGALVAFLQAMTQFGAPAILALPAGFHVITTRIWSLFQYPPEPHLAAAASLPLLLLTVLLLRGQHSLLRGRGYVVIAGKGGAMRRISLGRWRWPAFAAALAVLALPVLLPYAALFKTALVPTASDALTWSTLTLRNFRFVFEEFSATRLALANTLILGLAAATAGSALALVSAFLAARRVVPGAALLGALASAPAAIPGIVLGVGLFLAYTRPPFVLYGSLAILLLAFVTIELPAAYQQLRSALAGLHPELEEASRILGASRGRALWQITTPLLGSSVIATWCFIFIGAIRELSATIMLTTADTKLVSVIIYDLNESGDLGAISVLGITLLAITFIVVAIANRLPRRRGDAMT
ncbi:MAG TPA: iron ABC transporter permease [Stellaceae bacterium]|nr:iron ABC transporter permease [Stellaceae bacterium]